MIPSLALVLFGLAASHVSAESRAAAEPRMVAVTFDDLPGASGALVSKDVATLAETTRKLLAQVRRHGVPAVGFVNEGKLQAGGPSEVEARTRVLRMWVNAGLELGNHTYSHRDLNRIPLEEFEADVLRGETVTRGLLNARGRTLRYFRHPFLHVGADLATRRAFEAFLSAHGYVVAPVTVDDDEFVYAAAYARALRRGDAAETRRIGGDYLRYMEEVFTHFEDVSRRVVGRPIRHVLLLHANALNADRFGDLAEALTRRGYRFVTLATALEDDAYRMKDEFTGAPGNSWLNHWAVTAGGPRIPTPDPPEWIRNASR
jgi:peptidoglycan/xylan/chitin deacetylase (PgdA/CDA1 family)